MEQPSVNQPNQPQPQNPSPTKLSMPLVLRVTILMALIGISAFLLGRITSNPAPIVHKDYITPSVLPTAQVQIPSTVVKATTTQDDTTEWNTYKIPEVGIEFKLPKSFGDYKVMTRRSGDSTGTLLCLQPVTSNSGSFCNSQGPVAVGTTSIDFAEGREGTFTDLQGFAIKDGQYFAKFVGGNLVNLPQSQVSKITNANGVDVLKIKSNAVYDEGPSLMNSLGFNSFGLLINGNKTQYTGLAMVIKLNGSVTEGTVGQIISTINLIK